MLIALNYDGTYTRDTRLWDTFICHAKEQGHTIICFTMRHPHEPIQDLYEVDIKYTSRKAKKKWAEENGYAVDIWIDDKPSWLFENALS